MIGTGTIVADPDPNPDPEPPDPQIHVVSSFSVSGYDNDI